METSSGPVQARLRAARERLDGKDTAGAVAIYEEVLAQAGERADVLVTISGDLGSTGRVAELIELVAPRYDARRHGPATGFNLLQAYLAVKDGDSAQHILDLLFDLKRPELEERLYGFSNALADLLLAQASGADERVVSPEQAAEAPEGAVSKVGIVTISKPCWFYGLEAAAAEILPPKEGKLRRVAFAQLALPGASGAEDEQMRRPGGELALLSCALPAWFANLFTFAAGYQPCSAVACVERPGGARLPMMFTEEWGTGNLRQLVDTSSDGLDYILTGTLRHRSGDYELLLRLWEVRKFRERKSFSVHWTPSTVDAELERLRQMVCQFMEWSPYPAGVGVPFAPAASPRGWIEVLGVSQNLFLASKGIVPPALVGSLEAAQRYLAEAAPTSAIASLAWMTLRRRAEALGLVLAAERPAALADAPAVKAAEAALASASP